MKPSKTVDDVQLDGGERPVMLKKTGPYRSLAVKIGEMLVELWQHPKAGVEPYARIGIPSSAMPPGPRDREDTRSSLADGVTLDPLQAGVVVIAIRHWIEALGRPIKGRDTHALTTEVASLRLQLHDPAPVTGFVRAEVTIVGPGGLGRTAALTFLEAYLLAEVLQVISPFQPPEDEQ